MLRQNLSSTRRRSREAWSFFTTPGARTIGYALSVIAVLLFAATDGKGKPPALESFEITGQLDDKLFDLPK